MTKNSPVPQVSLDEIRNIYPHLPEGLPQDSAMHHPAILVFVHDPESAANATGQAFLRKNNDFDERASQPLAVAAQMIGADYKIFDLSPPTRQPLPATENDMALALSYGMVTVEQGVDHITLAALGQDTEKLLPQISSLDDLQTLGAMNVAACYGAYISARMAGVPVLTSAPLARCLNAIAGSEEIAEILSLHNIDTLPDVALDLIQRAARQRMRG